MGNDTYSVSVTWMQGREGFAQAPGIADTLKFSAPEEFGGQPGMWSPETLLVLAASSCFLNTLLFFAEKSGLTLVGYRADAEGRLERVPGVGFRFAELTLRPTVVVESETDAELARRLLEKAERACIVANSLAAPVRVQAEVELAFPVLNG